MHVLLCVPPLLLLFFRLHLHHEVTAGYVLSLSCRHTCAAQEADAGIRDRRAGQHLCCGHVHAHGPQRQRLSADDAVQAVSRVAGDAGCELAGVARRSAGPDRTSSWDKGCV